MMNSCSWVSLGCLLGVSWVSLGCLLVSLGCLLGVSWVSLGCFVGYFHNMACQTNGLDIVSIRVGPAPPRQFVLLSRRATLSRKRRGCNDNPRYFTSPLARAWSFAITAQSCSASPWATAPTSRSRQTFPLG